MKGRDVDVERSLNDSTHADLNLFFLFSFLNCIYLHMPMSGWVTSVVEEDHYTARETFCAQVFTVYDNDRRL